MFFVRTFQSILLVLLVEAMLVWAWTFSALAQEPAPIPVPIPMPVPMSADELALAMFKRDEGDYLQQRLTMTLISSNGRSRTRVAQYRRATSGETRRTLIRFTEPQRIRGSSFLTHEHNDNTRPDDQWLYLPALRRVRRVAASDRGDFFFGSDFTYEDVKDATKFDIQDYQFSLLSPSEQPELGLPGQEFGGVNLSVLEAVPASSGIAKELGYSRLVAWVDVARLIPLRVHYWDTDQQLAKRVLITALASVDGIWTPLRIEASAVANGHRSVFEFSDVQRPEVIENQQFIHTKLAAGH